MSIESKIDQLMAEESTFLSGGSVEDNKNIKVEAIDVSSDVEALLEGETLTEEFKEKAATIFEAAIVGRVKDQLQRIDEAYEQKLQEEVEHVKEGLIDQVDGYLDYVVEQWVAHNEIALDKGVKSEIMESFVGGLKKLFEDHYIDMPEEKYDVIGNLQKEMSSLQEKLNEQVQTNIGMKQKILGLQVKSVAEKLSEGLVETDKAKFVSLIEDLEVESIESFEKKAQTIRESYFKKPVTQQNKPSFITDNPVSLNEDNQKPIDPTMKRYISVLDSLNK